MLPAEAFKHYHDRANAAVLLKAHYGSHLTVAMLGMQCAMAAQAGDLCAFITPGTIGATWPDPLKDVPPDLGDKL